MGPRTFPNNYRSSARALEIVCMKYRDMIGSLFWITVGIVFCVGALHYGLFKSGVPEPGLLPFIAGVVLIILGTGVLVSSWKTSSKEENTKGPFFPERSSLRRLCFSVFALCAYLAIVEWVGFVLTTFLFMIFLMRFVEPQKWKTILTCSALTTMISYLLFDVLLGTHLPKGFLGL
jgi:putative tricarboxylic transport membrane protein